MGWLTWRHNSFTFALPEDLKENLLPTYSGRILIEGSNEETLVVPYFGEYQPLREVGHRNSSTEAMTNYFLGLGADLNSQLRDIATSTRITSTEENISIDTKPK